jgi:xylan 1,4-beta-xylosidase
MSHPITTLRPQWNAPSIHFRHSWEGVGNVDQFRWFVRKDLQDHLAMARDELGLRHVRAVGMYDNELKSFTKNPAQWRSKDAPLQTNWQVVDYAIRSLLDLGINPMFTTSFMPQAMASRECLVFNTANNTSPPKDWDGWARFVRESVQHAVDMWGRDIVRGWYFEVWNEPNLGGREVTNGFWGGNQADFFRLWSTTWRAIKSVDESFRVGGPSTARAEWIGDLLDYAHKDGTPIDYLIGHCYNNDSASNPLSPFDGPQEDRVNTSTGFFNAVVRGTRKLLDQVNFTGEVHWNEWGRSWFPCDPPRETALEAAFAVRSMAEVSQLGDYFAYWCLSDIYDQVGYQNTAFCGHYGMLNLHGLRKPHYHAFQLLGRLGTQRIPVTGGDGLCDAIATQDQGRHVLVYRHPKAFTDALTCDRVAVQVPTLPRNLRLYRIDRSEHNVIRHWQDLGAPQYLDRATLETLRGSNGLTPSAPTETVITSEPNGGGFRIEFDLDCPGVALLECD